VKLPWMRSHNDLLIASQKAKDKIYYRPFYIKNFAVNILTNANFVLAKYMIQEIKRSVTRRLHV
jgi:hypothetical protein